MVDTVKKAIEEATLNQDWHTTDQYGNLNKIKTPLNARQIHSLIVQWMDDPPSQRTVARIMKDLQADEPLLFKSARTHVGNVRDTLPWISVETDGALDQIQYDVRPLSLICLYKGIVVTLHVLMITDTYSDYTPVSCSL